MPKLKPGAALHRSALTPASVGVLHRKLGNQGVGRLLQAKLRVGQPGDRYEQEADRVADEVMRMTEPPLQRQMRPVEEEELLQTKQALQRQVESEPEEEEELFQAEPLLNRQAELEEEEKEEPVLASAVQRQVEEEEKTIQTKPIADKTSSVAAPNSNQTQVVRRGGEPLPLTYDAFFSTSAVQPKLTVSQPDDPYEQEADQMAEQVVRAPALTDEKASPEPTPPRLRRCPTCQKQVQRQERDEGGLCPECQPGPAQVETIQRQAGRVSVPAVKPDLEPYLQSSQGRGRPVPEETRAAAEQTLNSDLSDVRVHDDTAANEAAASLNARAFTHGSDIYLARGESAGDRRLVGHELTHTVQQAASPVLAKKQREKNEKTYSGADVPDIQAAWYNVDIPFTDYQFDPSLEGVKTAASIAKGTVVGAAETVAETSTSAFEWIYEKIKSVVKRGKKWIRNKWAALKRLALSGYEAFKNLFKGVIGFVKSPLGFVANAIINMDGEGIKRSWGSFTTLVLSVWDGLNRMGTGLLEQVESLWSNLSGFADSIFSRIDSLTGTWAFRQLPSSVRDLVYGLINQLRALWESVKAGWTSLFKKVKTLIDNAFKAVRGFIEKVLSFAIDKIILGILQFGQLLLFIKEFLSNPRKYLKPLAQKLSGYLKGVEGVFKAQIDKYFGSRDKAAPTATKTETESTAGVIQRQEDPSATRDSATWSEIGIGVWDIMKKKWEEVKKDPLSIVLNILMDLALPIVGNVKDIIKLFDDIKQIVTRPFSAGSLKELWTSLLQWLEIPILIYNTFWSIIGRTLALPLIIASFVPHPVVKAIAIAAGYALLGALIAGETANIAQKLLLLKTGDTTESEKKDVYNRLADSLIALAMELAMAILILVVSVVANVVKGVFTFVRGKVFKPRMPPKKAVDTDVGPGEKTDLGEPGKKRPAAEGEPSLETTKGKNGNDLTPEEIEVEFAAFKDGKPKRSSDPDYEWEVELPNGHKWKRKNNGKWCRFTKKTCFPDPESYDELGLFSDREFYEFLKKEGLVTESFEEFKGTKDIKPSEAKAGRPRTKEELLPGGNVPHNRKNAFSRWFDSLSNAELKMLMEDPKIKAKIAARIRSPGGLHEWGMVAEAPKLKELGVSMFEIRRVRASTKKLEWTNPHTGKKGGHGGHGSTAFHNELREIISQATSLKKLNADLEALRARWQIDPSLLPLPMKSLD